MRLRAITAGAVLLAIVVAAPDARAEGDDFAERVLPPPLIGAAVVDLGFVGYDTVLLARRETPSKTMGIVEGSVGAPQTLIGGVVTYILASERSEGGALDAMVPPALAAAVSASPATLSTLRAAAAACAAAFVDRRGADADGRRARSRRARALVSALG